MNKRAILTFVGIVAISFHSFGQKAKLREANREMDKYAEANLVNKVAAKTEAISKAKAAIDAAVADPSTSGDAKAWMKKADIYLALQEVEGLDAGSPYKEGIEALRKASELDPKLERNTDFINLSYKGAVLAFNDGINLYNSSKFNDSYNSFGTTMKLLGEEKDKKFPSPADTIRAQARMLQGFNAFYSDKTDDAIQLLQKAVNDPHLLDQQNAYLILAQAYEKQDKTKEQLKVLEQGLSKYPESQNLKNAKLNYLVTSGDYKSLEDAAKNDPGNVELLFNLGIIYQGLGFAKAEGTEERKNFMDKAESNYKKVLDGNSNNGIYNYQLGAFYFNQAAELTKTMNDLPISENAKYQRLKKERDAFFDKALPLLEKSRKIFSSTQKLSVEETNFYRQSLQALTSIYTSQDRLDEADQMNKELSGL